MIFTFSTNANMTLLESCRQAAQQHPLRVVLPDALDRRAVQAAQRLAQQGWAQPMLLANPFELRRYCKQQGIGLGNVPVVDPQYSPWLERYIAHYCAHRPGTVPEEASAQLRDPLWFGAMMVAQGDSDLCIAGNLAATSAVLRAGLRVIGLAEDCKTVSSIMFMIAPDGERVLGFTDCGVVPDPSPQQLADIAIAAAENYQAVMAQTPRLAMLSFSTRGSAQHPDAEAVRQATDLVRQRRPDLIVDGEMQFDVASVPSVAAQKAPDSLVQGDANVFVFPTLSAGNIGYKIAQRLGCYQALGPMIQGLRRPMHDLSRGCTAEDMVNTTLLAMKMAGAARVASAVPAQAAGSTLNAGVDKWVA